MYIIQLPMPVSMVIIATSEFDCLHQNSTSDAALFWCRQPNSEDPAALCLQCEPAI